MPELIFAVGGYLVIGSVYAAALGTVLMIVGLLAETAGRWM